MSTQDTYDTQRNENHLYNISPEIYRKIYSNTSECLTTKELLINNFPLNYYEEDDLEFFVKKKKRKK